MGFPRHRGHSVAPSTQLLPAKSESAAVEEEEAHVVQDLHTAMKRVLAAFPILGIPYIPQCHMWPHMTLGTSRVSLMHIDEYEMIQHISMYI